MKILIFNKKLYTFSPRNLDDWVDVASIVSVLNQICIDNNIPDKVHIIDMKDPVAAVFFGKQEIVKKS